MSGKPPNKQSSLSSFDSQTEERLSQTNIKKFLESTFQNFDWDYTAIKRQTGETIPIPKTSNCVSAIFEQEAICSLQEAIKKTDIHIEFIPPEHTRQYPDATLRFNSKLLAIDIKTTRITSSSSISGMTLGSYGRYFSNPTKDTSHTRFPYSDYDEHWVVCFAYNWKEEDRITSSEMVKDVEILIGKKWEFATNTTGSGTTTAIGSQTKLAKLRNRVPYFESKEEFETYWKEYE